MSTQQLMIATQLEGVVQRLVEVMAPERIFLYGSYAYGRPTPSSDIDLLIVAPTGDQYWDRVTKAKAAIEAAGWRRSADVTVFTPREFADCITGGNAFYLHVTRHGKLLYQSKEAPPMPPEGPLNIRAWVEMAEKDLRAASLLLDGDEPEMACGTCSEPSKSC